LRYSGVGTPVRQALFAAGNAAAHNAMTALIFQVQ
jgi:hypothetical protein